MAMTGKNRIMIYGPKNDGTYVVEFRTAACVSLTEPSNNRRKPPCMRVPRGPALCSLSR
jgi:hypothetical protein